MTEVLIALIAAVPATLVAWATFLKVRSGQATATDERAEVREQVNALRVENSAQHGVVAVTIGDMARRQEWLIDQLGEIRQSLMNHVLWEEGSRGDKPGKYQLIEQKLDAIYVIEQKLEAIESTIKEKLT